MFDPRKIQACLMNLVGWPQTYLKDYQKIDADLTGSISGVYIDQSAHPLITVENITASAKDYINADVSDYDSGITYDPDEVVLYGDIIYYSLQSTLNNSPDSSPTYWQASTLVSFYIKRVMKGAAINLFNTLFTQKKLYEAAKTLLTDLFLYEGSGNLKNKVTKTGRFVGYKITPKAADTVITISALGFQADTLNPELPFYLYHDSQNEPLQVLNIDVNKEVSFTWATLQTALKLWYNNEDTNTGGTYYLGYYEDDLLGQAIWRETNFDTTCGSCPGINPALLRRWTKFITIQPFYVDADFVDYSGKTLFDTDHIIDLSNQNWGMNLQLNVQCDVSDLICRNRFVFTDAYKLQIVKDLLNDMAFSTRDNQLKQKVQQMAMLALKGDRQDYSRGVESDLSNAIKAVSFDMSDMNTLCIPCGVGIGIEVSSVYS